MRLSLSSEGLQPIESAELTRHHLGLILGCHLILQGMWHAFNSYSR